MHQRVGEIVQGPDAGPAMDALRDFMFANVYLGPAVRAEHRKIAGVLRRLFEHYVQRPELLPEAYGGTIVGALAGTSADAHGQTSAGDSAGSLGDAALAERVTDYLAGMTDRYCIRRYTELEVPQAFAR
jgi:dGTPase